MTGILRLHPPAECTTPPTDDAACMRCGEPAIGASLPRAWTRALQGAALAFGAPVGWLVLRAATGHPAGAELAAGALLYLYMLVGSAVTFAAFGAALGRHEDCLMRTNRSLDELSVSDPVTGLRNARYFRARLREEQARAERSGAPLSIVVMDLDRFKRVNDRYGHPVGDEVLVAVSGAITSVVRGSDTAAALDGGTVLEGGAALEGMAARMGGEEFALLLPDTQRDEAPPSRSGCGGRSGGRWCARRTGGRCGSPSPAAWPRAIPWARTAARRSTPPRTPPCTTPSAAAATAPARTPTQTPRRPFQPDPRRLRLPSVRLDGSGGRT